MRNITIAVTGRIVDTPPRTNQTRRADARLTNAQAATTGLSSRTDGVMTVRDGGERAPPPLSTARLHDNVSPRVVPNTDDDATDHDGARVNARQAEAFDLTDFEGELDQAKHTLTTSPLVNASDLARETAAKLTRDVRPEYTDGTARHDPFGVLQAPLTNTFLDSFDHATDLAEGKGKAFLDHVSMTADVTRTTPPSAPTKLSGGAVVKGGVPRLLHAVWVGATLGDTNPKHIAFKEAMANNRATNPDWGVNLWTDIPRALFVSADKDSDVGKLRQWALDHKVNIQNIDEHFNGGRPMRLETGFKLERNKQGTGFAAASDILRLELMDRFGGIYVDGDKQVKSTLEKIAESTGAQGGFKVAQDGSLLSNCGFCAVPKHEVTGKILEKIKKDFELTRVRLFKGKEPPEVDKNEVISRTGPDVLRKVLQKIDKTLALSPESNKMTMTKEDITWEYHTSWVTQAEFKGWGDLKPYAQATHQPDTLEATQIRANARLKNVSDLQNIAPLNPTQTTATEAALKKALTSVLHGVFNLSGTLDLSLAEPHLRDTPNPDLSYQILCETLRKDEFRAVARNVTSVSMPRNRALSDSVFERIFLGDTFANLRADRLTLQEAALRGNLPFLDFAARRGLLKPETFGVKNEINLDAGAPRDPNVRRLLVGGMQEIFFNAIQGGDRDTIAFLMGQPGFADWMQTNPKSSGGQTPVLEAWRLQQMDTVTWLLDSGATLNDQGESLSTGFTAAKKDHGLAIAINALALTLVKFQAKSGEAPATILSQPFASQANSLLRALVQSDQSPELLTALERLGADWSNKPPRATTSPLEEIASRARGTNAQGAVTHFEIDQRIDDFVSKAMDFGNVDVVTARLNRGRLGTRAVEIGKFDEEAESVTAHHRFGGTNLERVKNDYTEGLSDSSDATARTALHKALTYATKHVTAGSTAPKVRLNGWKTLVNQVASSQAAKDNPALAELAKHVIACLSKVRTGLR